MAKKLYNLSVVNGSYKNKEGEDKNSYVNIGAVFQNDDGNGMYALLDKHINLAGLKSEPSRTSVLVGLYPEDNGGNNQRASANSVSEMKDDIPF
jgi:hypothetical protein